MSRIFISYKRVDKEKVFKIKNQIESALGEKCWIDLDGIESDAQFKNVIIKAINECEIVLFMYSKAHSKIVDFEKDWTVRELNFAQKKNKRIVFVNLDRSSLTDTFEFDYGTKQQIDALSQQAILRLIEDLKKWFDKVPLTTSNDNQFPHFPQVPIEQHQNTKYNKHTERFRFSVININRKYSIFAFIGFIIVCIGWMLSRSNNFINIEKDLSISNDTISTTKNNILCSRCNGTGQFCGSICTICSGRGYTKEDVLVSGEDVEEIILPRNGWYYYDDGTFSEANNLEKNCIGVIFGVGMTSDEEKKRGFKIGYIMALHDANEQAGNWGDETISEQPIYKTKESALSDINGYKHSFLEGAKIPGDRLNEKYTAFYYAHNYPVSLPSNTSGWYLPSVGQWELFAHDVLSSSIGDRWNIRGVEKLKEMNFKTAFYWTSTHYNRVSDSNFPEYKFWEVWNIELSTGSKATLHTYCTGFVGLTRAIAAF